MASQERLNLIKSVAQRMTGGHASTAEASVARSNPPKPSKRHPKCMPPIVLKRSEPMERNKALPGWAFWPQT